MESWPGGMIPVQIFLELAGQALLSIVARILPNYRWKYRRYGKSYALCMCVTDETAGVFGNGFVNSIFDKGGKLSKTT